MRHFLTLLLKKPLPWIRNNDFYLSAHSKLLIVQVSLSIQLLESKSAFSLVAHFLNTNHNRMPTPTQFPCTKRLVSHYSPKCMLLLILPGCAFAMQSNRLSHFFDLRGPSFTIDTACSSSLVALHQACQSIRDGESEMAIAGGCHVNLSPETWVSYSNSR